MSGSQTVLNVSTLTPLANAAGIRILGYNPTADTFVVLQPSALQGLQGPQGAAGPQGPQGPQGVPGSPGTNGRTILYGAGVPSNSLGQQNDFYIDTTAWKIHGPKGTTTWPAGVSLIGPQGPQGPAGGGGGSGNIANGTTDGQIAIWNQTAGQWQPQAGVAITGDRTPTVGLAVNTALTFAAHNRRRIVITGTADLTLALSEVTAGGGSGMEFIVVNETGAVRQMTAGAGLTVRQPATGTGTGQVIKIAAGGVVAFQCYPVGGATHIRASGDVA